MNGRLKRFALAVLVAVLGAATVVLPALAGSEAPTVEAVNYKYLGEESHYWSPSTASITTGAAVVFANSSATVPHGLQFTAGPGTPSCSGLPAAAQEASGAVGWRASCTFTAAGTYSFICTVHPATMKGTITVGPEGTTTTTTTSGGGTTPPPPGGTGTTPAPAVPPVGSGPPGALLVGGEGALKLSAPRHGSTVHGSIEVAPAGAGGTLEVDLLARSGALAARSSRQVRVGRVLLYYIAAGRRSFSVKLDARAQRSLRRRGRLALAVRIALTPPGGRAVTLSRALTLRR